MKETTAQDVVKKRKTTTLMTLGKTPREAVEPPRIKRIKNNGAFSMLLTGDITEKAERYLAKHDAPLQAEILKTPHHGSRTSSRPDFLRAIRPKDNVYATWGWPSETDTSETLGLHGQYGKEIWIYQPFLDITPEAEVFFRNGVVYSVSPEYLSTIPED